MKLSFKLLLFLISMLQNYFPNDLLREVACRLIIILYLDQNPVSLLSHVNNLRDSRQAIITLAEEMESSSTRSSLYGEFLGSQRQYLKKLNRRQHLRMDTELVSLTYKYRCTPSSCPSHTCSAENTESCNTHERLFLLQFPHQKIITIRI